MIQDVAIYILRVGQILVTAFALYYYVLSFFGIRRAKKAQLVAPGKRFALITAAHNEEKVIGLHIDGLYKLNYPSHLYDIYVIADNCTDRTAEIARAKGAKVLERFNLAQRGKGYALEWALEKLFAMDEEYDAVCIFDADNLVSPNFLLEMNNHLNQGHKCIQGYLDSKNPGDTWVTYCYAINFWVMNRFWQLAKSNVGFSNIFGGTGMCIDAEVLRRHGWKATCLTEDLEFSMKLLLTEGTKTYWAHDAVIYDEKPLTFRESWNQRMRWLQGHWDVASRYTWGLLRKGWQEKNWMYFDAALHLLQPAFASLGAFVLALSFLLALTRGSFVSLTHYKSVETGFLLMQLFYPWLAMYLEGAPSKAYLYYVFYPFFGLTWIPITIIAFFRRNNREWWHTKHVRSIPLESVVSSFRREQAPLDWGGDLEWKREAYIK